MEKTSFTANDNRPSGAPKTARATKRGETQGTKRPPQTRVESKKSPSYAFMTMWSPELRHDTSAQPTPAPTFIYGLAIALWSVSLISNMAAMLEAPSNTLHLLLVISAIWTSLGLICAAHSRRQIALAELASFVTIVAFGLSLYVTSLRFGIFAASASGAAIGAFAAILLGIITGSTLALRVSAAAALAWASICISEQNPVDLIQRTPTQTWLVIPALLGLQSYAASKYKDVVTLNISVIAAYALTVTLLIGLVSSEVMSAAMAASAQPHALAVANDLNGTSPHNTYVPVHVAYIRICNIHRRFAYTFTYIRCNTCIVRSRYIGCRGSGKRRWAQGPSAATFKLQGNFYRHSSNTENIAHCGR